MPEFTIYGKFRMQTLKFEKADVNENLFKFENSKQFIPQTTTRIYDPFSPIN
jgi:hypothetical protein